MTLKIGTVFKTMLWTALVGASAALVACGGGGGDAPAPVAGMGTVRVALTDAPRCKVGNDDLEKVFVTVERVRINESVDDNPRSGWHDINISPAKKINLLDLTNGRLEELGVLPIPAGTYSQVRLVLSPNGGAGAPANSVVLDGTTAEIPLRTPSAAQSGLKIIRPFTVAPNTLVDLVIDFDACRSIVALGNGGFLLKPVLTADLRSVAAIAGYVDPAAANVMVSAQKGGKLVRSTLPASNGAFVLAYLDPANGPYDVVFTSLARGTSVVAAVPVATTAVTTLSTASAPIPLPAAATTRTASGTLSPSAARDTAVLRALQSVGSVAAVEVATTNVNPTDGSYTLPLPTAAPLLATYALPLPLTFASPASPPADFSYRLEASAIGYVTQTQNIGAGTAAAIWSPTLVVAP
ncbi:MAG: DUF4382 domain-containing protein [Burkholderiaceae bacterium]|nr:DUF4382 domain-containing protein [Burkholderiaceae bacterium]